MYNVALIVKPSTLPLAILIGLCFPSTVSSNFLSGAEDLSAEGAKFGWEEAKSKGLRILVESRDETGKRKQATLGSGFLISRDGLFVTAYHVMKYCLENQSQKASFSAGVNCSASHPALRYKAVNRDQEFEIEIVSYLKEGDSISKKVSQTPDETIKRRDFVIGKLKAGPRSTFSYWSIRDFSEGTVNLTDPGADFELEPLLPPKKVFIVGYPQNRDFVIAYGFLNVTEANRRGYFATDLEIYTPGYLEKQGMARDTKWGIQVENHMSGGAVIDEMGFVVGVVVNGRAKTTGVLSIENVLETFFSRSDSGGKETVILKPTKAPLYLRTNSEY